MIDTHFEDTKCDGCGADGGRVLFEGPDRLHHLPGSFRLVQCETCGWIRQNPRPGADQIGLYYPADYEPYSWSLHERRDSWRQWIRNYGLRRRCRLIGEYMPPGDLLDVGCATGAFINEMRQLRGWRVHGVELNAEAAGYARDRLNLHVQAGRLENCDFLPGSLDVITMWNVLEHLPSPLADLRRVHTLLKDGGLFVFTIPNVEGLEARWFGPAWIGWDLPRHLYLFPQAALSETLSTLGFSVLSRRCLNGSADFFALSLQLYLQDRVGTSAVWPKTLARVLRSTPVRLVDSPLFWMMNQARLSTVMTFFAQKRSLP